MNTPNRETRINSRITRQGRGDTYQRERPSARLDSMPLVEITPSVDDLSDPQMKRINKLLKGQSTEKLFSLCLGLPSRVRSFMRRYWKRQDKWGESAEHVASDMAEAAAKILIQRMDVVMFFQFACEQEGVTPDAGRMTRMSAAKEECDALLTVFAYTFLMGTSARLAKLAYTFLDQQSPEFFLGGLIDIIEYGRMDPPRRRQRIESALITIKQNGWELPERKHTK